MILYYIAVRFRLMESIGNDSVLYRCTFSFSAKYWSWFWTISLYVFVWWKVLEMIMYDITILFCLVESISNDFVLDRCTFLFGGKYW